MCPKSHSRQKRLSIQCVYSTPFVIIMGGCLSLLQQAVPQVTEALGGEAEQGSGGDNNHNGNHNHSAVQLSSTAGTGGHVSTNSPCIYPSLPAGAEKIHVRNVYDGDTLTLMDERRVRFLGVDAPEIKEQQAFAQESKDYTRQLLTGKGQEVWISFEPGQAREDTYGRLLAFVWVRSDGNQHDKENDGYLCVNEGLVAGGYATAYTPNASAKMHNWDKFVTLQNEARQRKRGLWSTFSDVVVYKTANGSAYHVKSCEHLAAIRNLTELKASDAAAQGLHPCRTCFGK
jgi:endonuclease YncB( thermonuclease family)